MKTPCLLFALLIAAPARAQVVLNAFEVPLGGRSAILGTAAADAQDEAGMLLNPATLVDLHPRTLSLSLDGVAVSQARIHGFFRSSRLPNDWNDDGSSSTTDVVPASLAFFVTPTGSPGESWHQVVGVALIRRTPEDYDVRAVYRELSQVELALEDRIRLRTDVTGLALSWGCELPGGLAVGVTAMGYWLTSTMVTDFAADYFHTTTWNDVTRTYHFESTIDDKGILGVLGLRWRLGGFSVGASVRPPRLSLSRGWDYRTDDMTLLLLQNGARGSSRVFQRGSLASGKFDDGWDLRAGVALSVGPVSVAADAGWSRVPGETKVDLAYTKETYTLTQAPAVETGTTNGTVTLQSAVNGAVSLEVNLGAARLLAGLFRDASLSKVPDGAAGEGGYRLDRLGGALGVGLDGDQGTTYFGVRYTHGSGTFGAFDLVKTGGGFSLEQRHADMTEHRVMVVASGSLRLGGGAK